MQRMARRITWALLASSLPDWRKFWFEDVKNQLVLRIQRDPAGPRITHFLLIGHDLRTADLQEIPLGRIIQMINAGTAADADTPSQDASEVASELRAQADKLRAQADELDAQADAVAPLSVRPSGAEDAPTFQADATLRGEAWELGAAAVIAKPFGMEELLDAARVALRRGASSTRKAGTMRAL